LTVQQKTIPEGEKGIPMAPTASVIVTETIESEMILPVEFDEEELEVLATKVPTPFCGGGGGHGSLCGTHVGGRPGPV
jgi:hypothetical protein